MLASITILIFIALIGAANLCLGFAAAVAFGFGPTNFAGLIAWPGTVTAPSSGSAEEPARAEPAAPAALLMTEAASTPAGETSAAPDAALDLESFTAFAGAADAEEQPEEESPLADALLQLATGIDRFEAELADWDSRRRSQPASDVDSLVNTGIELQGLAAAYLERLRANLEPLDMLSGDAERDRQAIDEQAQNLSRELGAIGAEPGSLPFDAGEEAVHEALTAALLQVLASLHQARDQMEEPLTRLVGSHVDVSTLAPQLVQHAQVSLLGRLSYEHLCNAATTASQASTAALAMFDVDGLRQLNGTEGPQVARQALRRMAALSESLVERPAQAIRLAGKQFAFCLPNCPAETAAEQIERIRQTIEQTTFVADDRRFQVTVSAAVVMARPWETPGDLLARVRSTIREAKNYGRNRTFLWEGDAPTPVVPPELAIEAQTVAL